MWIYLPVGSFRSQPERETWTEGSDEFYELLAQSATLSTKSPRARYWRKTLNGLSWTRPLFGRTPEPSTADHGVDSWRASLGATPANPSAARGSYVVPTIPGTSGPPSNESSGKSTPRGVSSRTSPTISDLDSTRSPEAFKDWVTALRRHCTERRKSARPTSASGSSSSAWLTPTAYDAAWLRQVERGEVLVNASVLAAQAVTWEPDELFRPFREILSGLPSSIEHLTWPRPANPIFWEWMMGWPLGWTSLEKTASD